MSRALIAEKQTNLERIRGERIATEHELAQLAGAVREAADAAKAAKLATVITPSPTAAAQASAAAEALEAAVRKRDEVEERAELLDQAAKAVEAEMQDLERDVRAAERAAAAVELARRLDAGRAAARRWIIDAIAAEMLRGTIVTDAGLAALQALEPGQHAVAVVHAVSASASALCARINQGEVLS